MYNKRCLHCIYFCPHYGVSDRLGLYYVDGGHCFLSREAKTWASIACRTYKTVDGLTEMPTPKEELESLDERLLNAIATVKKVHKTKKSIQK